MQIQIWSSVKDLKSKKLIYLKAILLLVAGILASVLIVVEHPTLKTAVLLAIAVWCFARCYYFAFYVVEHYVDDTYRFAGLMSFVKYLVTKSRSNKTQ
jgi:Na+-transporting NADH:ubiquinone oxidoreductase subunit NqrD